MGTHIFLVIFMRINLGNLKIQLVAAEKDFRDEELFIPEDIFSEAGAFVPTASGTKKKIHGMLGGTTEPDLLIKDINVDHLDAIVIAGGSGSREYLWNDEALLDKVKEADDKGKIIGAICLSGAIPARAGIMRGRRGTVYSTPEALDELKKNGEIYVDEGVVVDRNVVTAQGPQNAKEFAETIMALLQSKLTVAQA
jgi:protease I